MPHKTLKQTVVISNADISLDQSNALAFADMKAMQNPRTYQSQAMINKQTTELAVKLLLMIFAHLSFFTTSH